MNPRTHLSSLQEPTSDFATPAGTTTVRVEMFTDAPDAFVQRAAESGADASADPVRDHQTPWGIRVKAGSATRSATSSLPAIVRRSTSTLAVAKLEPAGKATVCS